LEQHQQADTASGGNGCRPYDRLVARSNLDRIVAAADAAGLPTDTLREHTLKWTVWPDNDATKVYVSTVETAEDRYRYHTQRKPFLRERVVDLLETHYGKWFTLANISAILDVEPSHLTTAISRGLRTDAVERRHTHYDIIEMRILYRTYLEEERELADSEQTGTGQADTPR